MEKYYCTLIKPMPVKPIFLLEGRLLSALTETLHGLNSALVYYSFYVN